MYISRIHPHCVLLGKNFSPKLLENKLPDLIIHQPFEPNQKSNPIHNRKRLQNTEWGGCRLFTPESVKTHRIEWFFSKILSYKTFLEESGVTDATLWIYWYGSQGNMELSPKAIVLAHQIGWSLAMDYIYTEEKAGGSF